MLLRATLVKGRPQGKSSRQGHIDRRLHSIGGMTAEMLLKAIRVCKKSKPAVVEERPPWQYWPAAPHSWRPDEQHRLLVTALLEEAAMAEGLPPWPHWPATATGGQMSSSCQRFNCQGSHAAAKALSAGGAANRRLEEQLVAAGFSTH
jgi:hypothetical protein